jgi:hypothetical protein
MAMSRVIVRDGKSQYRLSQVKIKALKKKLRDAIRAGHTLREMAGSPLFYNGNVSFQTLGRFANERSYIPASYETCKALDILADPNPYRGLPKWFQRTQAALDFFNGKRAQIKQMSNEAKAQRKGAS